jgi:hypothetical protein
MLSAIARIVLVGAGAWSLLLAFKGGLSLASVIQAAFSVWLIWTGFSDGKWPRPSVVNRQP